jgi:hypothetical protein
MVMASKVRNVLQEALVGGVSSGCRGALNYNAAGNTTETLLGLNSGTAIGNLFGGKQ